MSKKSALTPVLIIFKKTINMTRTNVSIFAPNATMAFNFNNYGAYEATGAVEVQAANKESVNKLLNILFSDAQHYAMTYGVSVAHGQGKTFSAMHYAKSDKNVNHVFCNETITARQLRSTVKGRGKSRLFIFDDAQKLSDSCLYEVTKHVGRFGIVLLGNMDLRQRIIDGCKEGKPHYDDILNAVGKRFIIA
jgi:hypothetical protein